ncbi:hypothetical protein [Ruminococcus sp.]|uniref:hypothetical protein n=1 Tax=Ruminococcus sp. TaxID=41978 RepID=UPI0025CD9DB7|nr:hypothetical protein [Ruminococcus sp.]
MTGFVTYIFLLLLGAVFGLIWLILFIIGYVKKNKKRILLSFIPVGLFVFIAGGILASAAVKRHDFEKIPLLEVNNDTGTILGSTSSGSFGANYVIAEIKLRRLIHNLFLEPLFSLNTTSFSNYIL